MENLTENGLKAFNQIITAQNEVDVFVILDEFNIDSLEGNMLLRIFHETNAERQKKIEETNKKQLKIKIANLKKKHDYLQYLTNGQIKIFYEQLLLDKKNDDSFNLRYETIANETGRKRKIKRMKMKQEQILTKTKATPIYKNEEGNKLSYPSTFGSSAAHYMKLVRNAGYCKKCEHLIECKC